MPVKTLDEYTCLPYSVFTGLREASGQDPTVPEMNSYFVCDLGEGAFQLFSPISIRDFFSTPVYRINSV